MKDYKLHGRQIAHVPKGKRAIMQCGHEADGIEPFSGSVVHQYCWPSHASIVVDYIEDIEEECTPKTS